MRKSKNVAAFWRMVGAEIESNRSAGFAGLCYYLWRHEVPTAAKRQLDANMSTFWSTPAGETTLYVGRRGWWQLRAMMCYMLAEEAERG